MKELLNSRKLLVTLAILTVGSVFSWFDKLTPQLVELLTWIGGLYLGFNVTQKAAANWAVKKDGAEAPKVGP